MGKLPKKSSKPSASRMAKKTEAVLSDIGIEHACEILKRLADEDTRISRRIDALAIECLTKVDPDAIAESVFCDLNGLDVEELWKNSGSTRDGYVEPGELASEMFGEVLEPYIDELRKCQKLSRNEAAKQHCMGILKGIYKFEQEATTEFKDWAVDDPNEYFVQVLEEWMNVNKNPKKLEEMRDFVKKNFPEWYKDVPKKILGEDRNAAT